ncbi:MAG: dienelactone hydrolase [Polaromonas sp.]|nr:dienelactone hydrolase [Polaromonas sp.]
MATPARQQPHRLGWRGVLWLVAWGLAGCQALPPSPSPFPFPSSLPPSHPAPIEAGWVSWSGSAEPGSVSLRGWWSPAAGPGLHPVVVLLHGCGGMVNAQGQPTARLRTYAQLLNQRGWHTLAVDSLTPRGEQELCTQRTGTRRVTQAERRADALSALGWLATQPGVDPQRMALLGWSNGGSTVLAANNLNHPTVAAAQGRHAERLRLAVAFYPGCAAEARRGFQPVAPTLLLLGGADDWTPAADCQPLASDRVRVHTWAGAHHGFDGQSPVVHRADVPNGAHPGQGVHVGAHPQTRVEAQHLLVEALTQAFAR